MRSLVVERVMAHPPEKIRRALRPLGAQRCEPITKNISRFLLYAIIGWLVVRVGGLVDWGENAHDKWRRPGVPRQSRLRAHPSNLSGSLQQQAQSKPDGDE
jgi:hypothetical protein